jgi:hypothetical protein
MNLPHCSQVPQPGTPVLGNGKTIQKFLLQ